MSQTGQQIITTCMLSDIWRSKVKQAMKFGQSIEYNIKDMFPENHP